MDGWVIAFCVCYAVMFGFVVVMYLTSRGK